MKKFCSGFIILSAVMVTACNTPSTEDTSSASATDSPASFDMGKARSAIDSANAQFKDALKRGDSSALAALYASDAVVMPPNMEPLTSDIAKLWGGFIRMGVKDVNLASTDVSGNADILAETGTYEIFGDNNKSLDKGKYVVVWKPENGKWKLYRDIWSSNMPPPAAAKK